MKYNIYKIYYEGNLIKEIKGSGMYTYDGRIYIKKGLIEVACFNKDYGIIKVEA